MKIQHQDFELISSPMVDAVRKICAPHRLSETREAMLAFAIQNLATAIAEAPNDDAALAVSFPVVVDRAAAKSDGAAHGNSSDNRQEHPRNNKPIHRHFKPPIMR